MTLSVLILLLPPISDTAELSVVTAEDHMALLPHTDPPSHLGLFPMSSILSVIHIPVRLFLEDSAYSQYKYPSL